MASDLYRIKPLVWEDHTHYSEAVRTISPVRVTLLLNGKWRGGCKPLEDRESAKAAAEKWYRERLLTALEKVNE